MSGKGTPATAAASRAKIEFSLHAYAASEDRTGGASYGEEAADALGLSPDRVFKTLVAEVDGTLTVGVVPVGGALDLKALAAVTGGKKAVMADPADAERATGYVRGGISPLGQRKRLRTVIDASATGHDTIFVSAGRRGLQMELAPQDLIRLTRATRGPIGTAAG
ncbi:Cys-tRNA(Pro)/Cys-tRNA(Cys) deacylase [Spinactinospora alkalitolerans]|uniref:Cys-tRNA(Pro)/Cys-tRNA(Cys) deacylase n=1 Tax=Spinactinospora alkalitolerans TaxID=687207 RepID=A0A852TX97_9ACTN|nr:Cys-tRNA(Pro) deacylase [Spinactinospora alkalitolerans]NYE48568.1 Cys-tRNA(Pro)/Cys-tRNA(Cys) deacylase [Spinactinospora alkalitolerans]